MYFASSMSCPPLTKIKSCLKTIAVIWGNRHIFSRADKMIWSHGCKFYPKQKRQPLHEVKHGFEWKWKHFFNVCYSWIYLLFFSAPTFWVWKLANNLLPLRKKKSKNSISLSAGRISNRRMRVKDEYKSENIGQCQLKEKINYKRLFQTPTVERSTDTYFEFHYFEWNILLKHFG